MIEEKIAYHADKGEIVPTRDMLKTIPQIEGIQKSADLNTAVLDHVAAHIHAGMSTAEIDKLVYDYTTEHGGIPAPLNYQGFPKSVCTSINNEICHGIPDENIILEEGDIINVDVSTILDGYFSDASRMFMIGKVRTPTVSIPELIQLLSGKSMILYLPPNATAGLATFAVRTPSLLPCPPANSIAIISFFIMSSPLLSNSGFFIITYYIHIVNIFYKNISVYLSFL